MDRNNRRFTAIDNAKVALRKESVDRNAGGVVGIIGRLLSLSARRAWIEIILLCYIFYFFSVALRKESVDRNMTGKKK